MVSARPRLFVHANPCELLRIASARLAAHLFDALFKRGAQGFAELDLGGLEMFPSSGRGPQERRHELVKIERGPALRSPITQGAFFRFGHRFLQR